MAAWPLAVAPALRRAAVTTKARTNRFYSPGSIKPSPWTTPIRCLERRYARREIT
jgi:hypothetical protein